MGKKTEPLTEAVTLSNGTTISKTGMVVKEGKKKMIGDGKCVDLEGNIHDSKTYHDAENKRMKEEEKKKKEEEKAKKEEEKKGKE